MSNAWSESSASHSCSQRQRIIISSLTDMSDKAALPRSLHELIEAACDCLEQYHERSMDDKRERSLVDKAVQQTIHQGSEPSLRDSKRPFKLMMPAWRPVRPLLLPFCMRLIQGTYKKGISVAKPRQQKMQHLSVLLRFQRIPLAKPWRYAMMLPYYRKLQRHCHATSEHTW
jgi:hypothetical protein